MEGVYNASKAALTMFGETLRLEMLPLGIRVLTVIAGAMDTNIMRNGGVPSLSPSLPYYKTQQQITKLASRNDGVKRMKREEFAELVVEDVHRGASGKVWRGASASITHMASLFIPTSSMVSVIKFM